MGLLWTLAAASSSAQTPVQTSVQTLGVEESEQLVRAQWFEGLPEDEAARIGPEGAARLMEMLADPEDREHHANILVALGLSAQPGVFEAIAAWADRPRVGELDRSTFRAWQALPYALGHLAHRDPRALERLESRLLTDPAPTWHFRHHRGARLARQSRRAAASALALSGLPAARRALDRAGRDVSDADLEAHLESMRALHAQRALERERGR
jgi:hypothetical protein